MSNKNLEWIDHDGSPVPNVRATSQVYVRLRNGSVSKGSAPVPSFDWSWDTGVNGNNSEDIVAYAVVGCIWPAALTDIGRKAASGKNLSDLITEVDAIGSFKTTPRLHGNGKTFMAKKDVISGHFLETVMALKPSTGKADRSDIARPACVNIKIGDRELSISVDNSLGHGGMDVIRKEIRLYVAGDNEVTNEVIPHNYSPDEATMKKAMAWVMGII